MPVSGYPPGKRPRTDCCQVTGASGAGKSSVVNALRSLRDPDFGGGGLILCRVQGLGFRKGFVRASYYSIHGFYGLSSKQPGFYDETSLWVSPWVSVSLRVSGYFLRVLRSY